MTALALIAGGGHLPVAAARSATRQGYDVHSFCLPGADQRLRSDTGSIDLALGAFAHLFATLEARQCRTVCFVGGVSRPASGQIDLTPLSHSERTKLLSSFEVGDSALLAGVISILEVRGYEVIGGDKAYPDLLTPEGLISDGLNPERRDLEDVMKAFRLARLIGQEDVGQGAVVADGLVLALEAQEGTDAMLQRVADLPPRIRGIPGARRGVLAKLAMPIQDLRVDLPVIGPETIERADLAGLAGIALRAGESIIDQYETTRAMAERAGLFILGVSQVADP